MWYVYYVYGNKIKKGGNEMKKVISVMLMVISMMGICSIAFADQYVRGHVRRDGTYVQGHYRSDRDGYRENNWSHIGNVNPHTGARGTKW